MKRHSAIHVDLQLIGKYLSGEASPKEALAIDRWREKSTQNNDLFESAMRIWNESAAAPIYRQPHHIDQWLKLKKAIKSGQKRSPSITSGKILIRWAAAALLLLGIAALVYLLKPHAMPTIYSNVIQAEATIVRDTLTDSSVITLHRHSNLSVQEQFALTGRKVKLDGEGHFLVRRLNRQPFIIYTGGIEIIVLGTTFNVRNDPEKVTVSVRNGMVKMKRGSESIVIGAGSTGIFHKTDRRFVLYADSLNRNMDSYATDALYFNNVSMKEVKAALENTYGVTIIFKNEALSNLRINTQFKKQPLDYVLKVIGASLDIQYQLKNDTLYFGKGSQ